MRKRQIHPTSSQSGNVLFIILIAVALFAALSYAVTQSSRGGGNDANDEILSTYVAQISQYSTALETAIMKLRISNKCEDTTLSFERAPFDGSDTDYVNPNAPSDFSCHVFHPNGGEISYIEADLKWLDPDQDGIGMGYGEFMINGMGQREYAGADCADTTCSDLILYLPNLKQSLCEKIREDLGHPTTIPQFGVANFVNTQFHARFKGTYFYNNSGSGFSDTAEYSQNGCMTRYSGSPEHGMYTYYHVLLPR